MAKQRRNDGWMREDAMVAVVLVGLVMASGLAGPVDRKSASVTAAHVKEATERKQDVRPEDFTRLRSPVGLELCSATMGSGYHAHKMKRSEERCYIARSAK